MLSQTKAAFDASLGSEPDDSSDKEEETQEINSETFGEAREDPPTRSATTPTPRDTTTHREDDSILVEDEEEIEVHSLSKKRGDRRSPRGQGESSSNTQLSMKVKNIKAMVEQLKGQMRSGAGT